ncbi:MAG: hypothetical protein SF187_21475 [Deltaproteobacteria bacterium]|nr:hypothetical protein [Deltaproteobacteria bacterium]
MKTSKLLANVLLCTLSAPAWAQAPDAQPVQAEAPAAPATEQAAPPAPAPADAPSEAAAPSPATEESIDLAALGISDASGGSAQTAADSPLQFYGFADFGVMAPLYKKDSLWSGAYAPSYSSAAMGNLNLYLAKQLDTKWRALTEVRFHYAPFQSYDDPADSYRPAILGAMEIERAHIDYQAHQWLNVRAGQWLTPYGIWNVDHGTPTLIAIRRPYSIGEQLFPERQTGLLAFGGDYVGPVRLGYHFGVSNGRGPRDSVVDLDKNKAVTARVDLAYGGSIGDVKLGFTFFRGKYTAAGAPKVDFATGKSQEMLTTVYDEQSVGADLQYDFKGFVLRSEFLYNERKFQDPYRPRNDSGLFAPNSSRWGAYGLAGYRIPVINLMPYFLVERYSFGQGQKYIPNAGIYYIGLNWQIVPSVVAKAEFIVVQFPGSDPLIDQAGKMRFLSTQLAWAF